MVIAPGRIGQVQDLLIRDSEPALSAGLIMPITTAIYNAHSHKINSLLSDIEEQFTLDEQALISITSHFHKLFNVGLGGYNHPMAMMYVCAQSLAP